MTNKTTETIKDNFLKIIASRNLKNEKVIIKAKVLSDKEALGNPLDRDYPLIKGKEKLMQARYKNSVGVAFTDMFGDYEDYLFNIMDMDLENNFKRAIFISVINAVLRHLNLVQGTAHCKDNQLLSCRDTLKDHISNNYGNPKILLAGFQPRFVEVLCNNFDTVVLDMDKDNIGKATNNCRVEPAHAWKDFIDECDLLFVTGSSFVNDTAQNFIIPEKQTLFYGVTCAGPCFLLNLPRYCPEGN